jgi:ribosome-associated protein
MATPETRRQLLAAVSACEDKKGEDTRILELDPADSGLADFFLITSATNDRQVVAIADEIEMRLKKEFGLYPTSVEGRRQGEWILLDYVDIVIHVFLAEKRAFYDIERLRKSARNLTGAEVEAELRSALAQKTRAVRGTTTPAPTGLAKRTPTKSSKGDSTVSAKAVKKAAKKAAKKAPAKPVAKKAVKKAVKPAAKKAAKKAAKPAQAKSAAKKSVLKPAKKAAAPAKKQAAKAPVKAAAKKAAKAPLKAAAKKLPVQKKTSPPKPPVAAKKALKKAVVAPPNVISASADPNAPGRPIDGPIPAPPPPPPVMPTQGVKPPIIREV